MPFKPSTGSSQRVLLPPPVTSAIEAPAPLPPPVWTPPTYSPGLIVLTRNVPGFALLDEHQAMISIKGYPTPLCPVVPAIEALSAEHANDAHFCCFGVLNLSNTLEPRIPRLTKGVLSLMTSTTPPIIQDRRQVVGTAIAIDFDLPQHAKWTDGALAHSAQAFQQVSQRDIRFVNPTCWYTTSGGCRYVWLLSRPVPVEGAGGLEDLLGGIVSAAHMVGLAADPQCRDWTRLFRLPRVQRDDKQPGEQRTQDQSYFRMSWGRVDTTAKELAPTGAPLLHDPSTFPLLSSMRVEQFDVNDSARTLGKLWERRIGKIPAVYSIGQVPEMQGPAPSPGEMSLVLQDSDGKPGESAILKMLRHTIHAQAFPRSDTRKPFPSAVEAWDYMEGRKSLYTFPDRLEGLHAGILGMTRTLCSCLRERLGPNPGQIGPKIVFTLVYLAAKKADQQRPPEQQRSDDILYREVWEAVGHVYRQFRFEALTTEADEAEGEAAKLVTASAMRLMTDAMQTAIKAQLREWAIDSIPGERDRAQAQQATADAGADDQSALGVIEQWIDSAWKRTLLLEVPDGRSVLTFTPSGAITYSRMAKSDGGMLAMIGTSGHDIIPTHEAQANPLVPPKRKAVTDLMADYSTSADLCFSRIIPRSRLRLSVDESQQVHVTLVGKAAGMRKDIRPMHNPLVEGWLHCLAGKNIDKLLDWLAAFPLVSEKIAGLYLEGRADVGKGLLGLGLANMTETRVFAPFNEVVEQFQDTMIKTPLVWADEDTGANVRNGKPVMNVYKRLVTGELKTLNAKGKSMSQVDGYWRVYMTANSDRLLSFEEDVNENDLGALVQRTIHIPAHNEAAEYLKELGGQAGTLTWPEREIPQHIMWLHKNRQIVPGTRLYVEGVRTEYHDKLMVNTGGMGTVVRALGRILQEPAKYPEAVTIKGLDVLVNVSNLHGVLEVLFTQKSTRVPAHQSVTQSIKNLSASKHPQVVMKKTASGPVAVEMWPLNMRGVFLALKNLGENFHLMGGVGEKIWEAHAPDELKTIVSEAVANTPAVPTRGAKTAIPFPFQAPAPAAPAAAQKPPPVWRAEG